MKVRKMRVNRLLLLWGALFLATIVLVAQPTEYRWGYWVYGLIWGSATSTIHYLFQRFFEEEKEISDRRTV